MSNSFFLFLPTLLSPLHLPLRRPPRVEAQRAGGAARREVGGDRRWLPRQERRPVPAALAQGRQPRAGEGTLDQRGEYDPRKLVPCVRSGFGGGIEGGIGVSESD